MILITQNKESVILFGKTFNALKYHEERYSRRGKETVRHTICISDGLLEEVAEYESKERCLEVLMSFCNVYLTEDCMRDYVDGNGVSVPVRMHNNTVFEFPER